MSGRILLEARKLLRMRHGWVAEATGLRMLQGARGAGIWVYLVHYFFAIWLLLDFVKGELPGRGCNDVETDAG